MFISMTRIKVNNIPYLLATKSVMYITAPAKVMESIRAFMVRVTLYFDNGRRGKFPFRKRSVPFSPVIKSAFHIKKK